MQVSSILTESTVLYYDLYEVWESYNWQRNLAMQQLTHWNTVCPLTLFSQGVIKLFKMGLMHGLLLMVNQDISWHECNSKRSVSNKCYSTQQDQTSRVLAAMYHIHDLHVMPWMPLSYTTALNSPALTSEHERLYIASPVSLTHLVSIPWWCKDLARVMHVYIGTSVDAAQNISLPKLNAL